MTRTGKIFIDYNAYHDRPFGLKWGTAYAMEELVKAIAETHQEALEDPPIGPAMAEEEIDQVFTEAFQKGKWVKVYRKERDALGHLMEPVVGRVLGQDSVETIVVGEKSLPFAAIYRVELIN